MCVDKTLVTKLIRLIQPLMESVLAYQPKSLFLIFFFFFTTKSVLFAMLYSFFLFSFFFILSRMLQYAIKGYNYWVLHRNLLEFISKFYCSISYVINEFFKQFYVRKIVLKSRVHLHIEFGLESFGLFVHIPGLFVHIPSTYLSPIVSTDSLLFSLVLTNAN